MQDRVWGEKEIGLRTESWRTLTVAGGEEQKDRGSRKKMSFQRAGGGSPIFYLFSSATHLLLPLTSQEVGWGRPRGTLVPAQAPECSHVKGSQARDWSAWVLELLFRQGGLPPPSPFLAVWPQTSHTPCDLQPFLHLPEGITTGLPSSGCCDY